MPRSHAIWVVIRFEPTVGGTSLEQAFTVKRELAHWYAKQEHRENLFLYRCENPVSNSGGRLGHFISDTEPVLEPWDEVLKLLMRYV